MQTLRRAVVPLLLALAASSQPGCSLTADLSRSNLYPEREFRIVPEDLGLAPESLAIPVEGATIRAWFFRAGDSDCTLLVCGGNSSNMQLLLPIAQTAVAAGYNAVLFDYRGFGLSSGEPDVFSIVPDSVAVLEAVKRLPGTRRLALYGISLGSVAAVGAASERPELVDAIVVEALFSPRVQIRKEMGAFVAFVGRLLLFPGTWNVESNLPDLPQPMLLVHGDRDEILPIEDSLPIYEAMPDSAGPRFLWVPAGAGHAPGVSARFGPDYAALVTSFLDRHLRGVPTAWFAASWERGQVRLQPLSTVGGAVPVEISAIAADGTPHIVRAWFDPVSPAPAPLPLEAPPVFVSAVAAAGPVERDGDSWIRSGRYVRSWAAWWAFDDALEEMLEQPFRAWQVPVLSDEILLSELQARWKREGREEDAEGFLRRNGMLRATTTEGLERRHHAELACGLAETALRDHLAADVHPDVRPRYAAAASRIAECFDALGGLDSGVRALRLRLLQLDLIPPVPEARIEFGDASWSLGAAPFQIPVLLNRLVAADPSRALSLAEWREREATRGRFLKDWLDRNAIHP